MLIAVMSDSHDHLGNLDAALKLALENRAAMIVHCGDFVAPFSLRALDEAGIPVHGVFGNNDGDQYLLTRLSMSELERVTLHGQVGTLEVQDCRLAFTHLPIVGQGLAATGDYDLVCFGHSHNHFAANTGRTLLLNPGEIMGKDESPGFCLYDTSSRKYRRIILA